MVMPFANNLVYFKDITDTIKLMEATVMEEEAMGDMDIVAKKFNKILATINQR